jgi:uncharacterized RDD family membrane protein YckC
MMSKYQTTSRRFWAGLIDALFISLTFAVVRILVPETNTSYEILLWILVCNLFAVSYHVFSVGFYGKTIGKRLFKIKVLDISEAKVTLAQACWREIFYIITNLIYFAFNLYSNFHDANIRNDFSGLFQILENANLVWFLVEIVSCLTNEKRRAIHDFMAGTVVINTEFVTNE